MAPEPSLRDTLASAATIVSRCETIQPRTWGAEGATIELVKQVGDLARHVMTQEGYYGERDDEQRYADIDLPQALDETRQAEDTWLKTKNA